MKCRSFPQRMQISQEASSAGSQLSPASIRRVRRSLRRCQRMTSRSKQICARSARNSQAPAISGTQYSAIKSSRRRHGSAAAIGIVLTRRQKNLTRRANHLHIFNFARIEARAGKPAAGFLIGRNILATLTQDNRLPSAPSRRPQQTELAKRQRRPCNHCGRPAKTSGKPNRKQRFRAIARQTSSDSQTHPCPPGDSNARLV